jgi:hypothetical protein
MPTFDGGHAGLIHDKMIFLSREAMDVADKAQAVLHACNPCGRCTLKTGYEQMKHPLAKC